MKQNKVIEKLKSVHDLPTLPIVIQKVRETVADPHKSMKELSNVIKDDPAIMTKIMKVVNSSFYSFQDPITSLPHAVSILGQDAIQNIAMSLTVFDSFRQIKEPSFSIMEFWTHCISVGLGANIVFEKIDPSLKKNVTKDMLHLAGIVHDIGIITLEKYFHKEFRAILKYASREKIPIYEAEYSILQTTHEEVGAYLAEKWLLGKEFQEVIRWHHHPHQASENYSTLVSVIHIADYICNFQNIGFGKNLEVPVFYKDIWKTLGLEVSQIPEIDKSIRTEAKKSEILLALLKA